MTPSRGKGRVLVVDDDELITVMLAKALGRNGFDVRQAKEAAVVLEEARAFSPDVVLMDVNLPGKTGLELLQEMNDEGIGAPTIMLTADDTAETAVKAMKLGAADYHTKPFNLEEVALVVGSVLERRTLRQEVDYLRKVSAQFTDRLLVGTSAAIARLKDDATRLTEAGVNTILITGESGTGKEVFARYTHQLMYARLRAGAIRERGPAPLDGFSTLATEAMPLTTEGTILGTVQYTAPEQLEGREADARTDIFALGAVLYEMATGQRAFQGGSKTSLIAAIGVQALLAASREERKP